MIDFYHLPSSCSTAVKAALALTGEPHSIVPVDLSNKTDAFVAANPLGKVPALVFENTPLSEGGAINLWLSARNPDAGLMPALDTIEGANALKWLFFVYASIHPVWVRLFMPERFADESAKPQVISKAMDEAMKLYSLVDAQLAKHDFVAGDQLTLADLYLAATTHWDDAIENAITKTFPSLAVHRDRVVALSRVRPVFSGEFGYD
ncbi:glutathione S-transferase family protein [Yoonia sp. R2331]|uniref:glutathione S-transferase family protein n=1 Tax=Yoonia sp. R2331 TaxID=3237238 RepID=UPI0034E37E79